jgi:hypothetical protein
VRVGVEVPDREGISYGVVLRIGNRSGYWGCDEVEVREGRRVEESVFRPVGVSRAVT